MGMLLLAPTNPSGPLLFHQGAACLYSCVTRTKRKKITTPEEGYVVAWWGSMKNGYW